MTSNARDFATGAVVSIDNDMSLGILQKVTGGLQIPNSTAYYAGKVVGDIGSLVAGTGTIAGGLGGEAGGVALDATGVGAIPGVALNVASAGVGAYGGEVVVRSAGNFGQDARDMFVEASGGNEGAGKPTSKTFGQPIETKIGGTKVKLRVDAEPDANKIQIQAGHGKDSIVDVRIDPAMPLEPQIPKNLNLSSGQKQELLKNLQKAVDFLNN